MKKITVTKTSECINCYRQELLIYLVRHFSSLDFAERIFAEMELRLENSEFLNDLPNPHFYLTSYALSLGLEFMQAELQARKDRSKMVRLENAKAMAGSRISPMLATGDSVSGCHI